MIRGVALFLLALASALVPLGAQSGHGPSARLSPAPALPIDAKTDSNVPMVWDLVDGAPTLFAFASWGGVPALLAGPELSALRHIDSITVTPHPGHGVWLEAVVADEGGTWYGFYHHEVPAEICGRPDRTVLSIGSARSRDHGRTWDNLGIVLEGPPDTAACASTNRFLLGGVGDPTAILDADRNYLYLYFSQYGKPASAQGVAVARMPWPNRDNPAGAFAVRQDGAWIPSRLIDGDAPRWEYVAGTPLVVVTEPWHDGDNRVDAFWGPSLHWNTYLECYVMLLNRAKNENFDNEGIYVSFAPVLDDVGAWSVPQRLMSGGGWYPEVAGLGSGGTDKEAGQRARFFLTGRSDHYIEFSR
jgi:hypothetical protein